MSTSPYHHGDLRRALIEAGLRLLRSRGAGGLALRAVAREAGVSPAAPYRHFADKEAMLAAIAAEGFERLAAALRAADASADGIEALRAQGAAYVGFALEEAALFRLMFGAERPAGDAALAQQAEAAFGVLRARVATLLPESQVAVGALTAWSLVHGLACLIADGRIAAPDPRALVRDVLAQFALAAGELR